MAGRNYRDPDIKKLFALSKNECAMDECHQKLADPKWPGVMARICHIRAHSVGGPRFDPMYQQVDGFENLILLCPSCHTLIDELEQKRWTVDALEELKARHESAPGDDHWASDAQLMQYVAWAMAKESPQSIAAPEPARLVCSRRGSEIILKNVGGLPAKAVALMPADGSEGAVLLGEVLPSGLDAGEELRVGHYAATFGDVGPHAVQLMWDDGTGTVRQAKFAMT